MQCNGIHEWVVEMVYHPKVGDDIAVVKCAQCDATEWSEDEMGDDYDPWEEL